MTPAVLDRPARDAPSARDRDAAARAELAAGGRPVTLEELLSATLHAARTNGSTECPVCHARMTSTRASAARGGAEPGAGAQAGAECGDCGSRLS